MKGKITKQELDLSLVGELDDLQQGLGILTEDVATHEVEKLNKNGGVIQNYSEVTSVKAAATGAVTLNIADGNVVDMTLAGATTLTFTTPVASGKECSFTLYLRQGATAYAVTWPASLKWDNDAIPDISAVNKTNILVFTTLNGGTRWYGRLAMGNLVS